MPILTGTRVISQALEETFDKLAEYIDVLQD